ncbi:hypothetical protein KCP71_22195 [Salmonella enterica subsp. enterica]|nr:hypothetical protein KCP71_22195 [Salmonella enterica subsp. enterica]
MKRSFSCTALRHKTSGSANHALPIKIDNHSGKTVGTLSARIKPVFVLKEMVNVPLFQAINEIYLLFAA